MLNMKIIKTGNAHESIDDCLCYLESCPEKHDQLRVSLIYGSGDYETRIGDELRLSKELGKRWWERLNKHQLRLPFTLYQPARVESNQYNASRDEFSLQVQHLHEDGTEHCTTLRFRRQYKRQSRRVGIRAIRIHKLITSQPHVYLNSHLMDNAMRAGEDGLVVLTSSGEVYNKATKEFVGTELRIDHGDRRPGELNGETVSLRMVAPQPMLASIRLPDDSDVSIRIYNSVEYYRSFESSVNYSETTRWPDGI